MNESLTIYTLSHPLARQIAASSLNSIDLNEMQRPADVINLYPNVRHIFDLTILPNDEKEDFLNSLCWTFSGDIYSDLTYYWGESIAEKMPRLRGAMALAFYAPKNHFECWAQRNQDQEVIKKFLTIFSFSPHWVRSAGICFTYPRIISMIINEAFFALEDQLASSKDIDQAMKFGVNYPLGPLEWAQKIGLVSISRVLSTLLEVTGDSRYRQSVALKKESLHKEQL